MGKVTPAKRKVETPSAVKALVDKIVATPCLQLADVFGPFAWTFGRVSR